MEWADGAVIENVAQIATSQASDMRQSAYVRAMR